MPKKDEITKENTKAEKKPAAQVTAKPAAKPAAQATAKPAAKAAVPKASSETRSSSPASAASYADNITNANTNNLNLQAMTNPSDEAIVIDLMDMFNYFLSKWKIILLCFIIGAGLGAAYQHFLVGTTYRADATIFVADTSTMLDVYDLSLSNELSKDYQDILLSRQTLKEVDKDLNLGVSYSALRNVIELKQDEESHIITIYVTTSDKVLSQEIANSMVRVGSKRINEVTTTGSPTVIDYSTADSIATIKYGVRRYPFAGGVVGACIPMAILLIMYLMDRSFKSEDEIVERLKRPVIANIPYLGKMNLVSTKLNYFEKEAFNTLYGNISLSGLDNRVIAMTSSNAHEGKSSVSFKLAEVITDFNKTVCYIDCDMRNSYFCRHYGIDKNDYIGLSGFLSNSGKSIASVMFKDENNDKLSIIPPGKNPPNPSALISSERFEKLLKVLRTQFDYVIIDTPPINAVIDGVFVAKQCDATVLVIESAVTDSRQAMRAANDLNMANVNLIGIVANKVGKKKGYGYGYGKYRYGYRYKKGYSYGYGYGYGYGRRYGRVYGYGHEDSDESNSGKNQSRVNRIKDKIQLPAAVKNFKLNLKSNKSENSEEANKKN